MSFPNYTDANSITGFGHSCLESNRTQALLGNLVVTGLTVSQRAAGANMSVDVAAGLIAYSGAPVGVGAEAGVLNKTITAADVTNPRYDVVYATSAGAVAVAAGTAASSPKIPDLPANAIALALVTVAANASSIATANITDLRFLKPNVIWTDPFTLKTSADLNAHRIYTIAYSTAGISNTSDYVAPTGLALGWNGDYTTSYIGSVYSPAASPLINADVTQTQTVATVGTSRNRLYESLSRKNMLYGVTPTTPAASWGTNYGTAANTVNGDYSAYTASDTKDLSFYRDLPAIGTNAEEFLIKYDMGAVKTIKKLLWAAKVSCTGTGVLRLKTSTDDSTYTTQRTLTVSGSRSQEIYPLTSDISARYVAVTVQATGGSGSFWGGVYNVTAWV